MAWKIYLKVETAKVLQLLGDKVPQVPPGVCPWTPLGYFCPQIPSDTFLAVPTAL